MTPLVRELLRDTKRSRVKFIVRKSPIDHVWEWVLDNRGKVIAVSPCSYDRPDKARRAAEAVSKQACNAPVKVVQ